jgi:hypothetical protein
MTLLDEMSLAAPSSSAFTTAVELATCVEHAASPYASRRFVAKASGSFSGGARVTRSPRVLTLVYAVREFVRRWARTERSFPLRDSRADG